MILTPSLFVENCPSTNAELKRQIEDNLIIFNELKDFFLLYTNYQNAGRGVADNRWESERNKNVLASFYFKPPIPPQAQFRFNQFFSLTILNAISHFLPNAKIKWPNDIYVDTKKIAGILIEHSLSSDKIKYTIAGVGLNVNQLHFPTSLPNPTSLAIETGEFHNLDNIINLIIEEGQKLSTWLAPENSEELNELYLSKLLNLNVWKQYEIFGRTVTAKITGTDSFGRLQLIDTNDNIHICHLKEIKFIFP